MRFSGYQKRMFVLCCGFILTWIIILCFSSESWLLRGFYGSDFKSLSSSPVTVVRKKQKPPRGFDIVHVAHVDERPLSESRLPVPESEEQKPLSESPFTKFQEQHPMSESQLAEHTESTPVSELPLVNHTEKTPVSDSPLAEHTEVMHVSDSPLVEHTGKTPVSDSPLAEYTEVMHVSDSPLVEHIGKTQVSDSQLAEHAEVTPVSDSPLVEHTEKTRVSESLLDEHTEVIPLIESSSVEHTEKTPVSESQLAEHTNKTSINESMSAKHTAGKPLNDSMVTKRADQKPLNESCTEQFKWLWTSPVQKNLKIPSTYDCLYFRKDSVKKEWNLQDVLVRQNFLTLKCSPRLQAYSPTPRPKVALASSEGSGNTWTRHLIEQFSGIHTGSVYCGKPVRGVFLAECKHNKHPFTSAIKTHSLTQMKMFDAAVLIIRNPYDAIFADFNRLASGKTGSVTMKELRSEEWNRFVYTAANRWYRHAKQWLTKFKRPIHVLVYERLLSDFYQEVFKLASFLKFTVTYEDLWCLNENREGSFHRKKVLEPVFTKKQEIYIDQQITQVKRLIKQMYGIVLPF